VFTKLDSNFICNFYGAATAGVPCQFSIIARDRFGNLHFGETDQAFLYLSGDLGRHTRNWVVSSTNISSLLMYTIGLSMNGRMSLNVMLSESPGVLVEYFAREMHWVEPILSEITMGILPLDHYSAIFSNQSLLISQYTSVGVRWSGLLRLQAPQLLTFLLECGESLMYDFLATLLKFIPNHLLVAQEIRQSDCFANPCKRNCG
jgi:hypothetical protein